MRPYNRRVRRCAAILVLILFASLNAIDGICCPDGCTHDQTSPAGDPTSGGACVLCTGGVQSQVADRPSPGVPLSTVVTRVAMMNPIDVSLDPPEHPPRS